MFWLGLGVGLIISNEPRLSFFGAALILGVAFHSLAEDMGPKAGCFFQAARPDQ
jgi:hypothetical protein